MAVNVSDTLLDRFVDLGGISPCEGSRQVSREMTWTSSLICTVTPYIAVYRY